MVDSNDVQLSWEMEEGSPGTDFDASNPLARAADSPFLDGRPQQRLSLCFYRDLDEQSLRWLGTFVLSGGGRVIFFPGLTFDPTWILVSRKKAPHKRHEINIDHITLDGSFHRWHLSSRGSAKHLGSGTTTDLAEGRFLWFGMSLAGSRILRPVMKRAIVRFHVPSADSRRRMDSFMASREGAVFNCVSLSPDARDRYKDGFLHFGFVVGPSGFPDYRGTNLGIPFGSPFLRKPLPPEIRQLPLRSHRLSLGNVVDIEVITAWLPGNLSHDVTFTGQSGM